ncbi:hypothetical protein [Corallococcus sp. CA053C]|uniref:hypothetical protein n=1 Tax=Corallococcus sp. CA053C TaxID=2316732 RepID=UPI0011C3B863|nr:hypothetical protein [Corallococcus sp. CA053C]
MLGRGLDSTSVRSPLAPCSPHRRASLGALGGATAGMLLGLAAHEGLRHLAGSCDRWETVRRYIAYACTGTGTGATLGCPWIRTPRR